MDKKNKLPKTSKKELISIINIGSDFIRLKIAQSSKGKLKYIESLSYHLALGKDTFDSGKISFEKIDKACDILKNYVVVSKEYGVSDIITVATSAIREATNKEYMIDQIKIKTGLDLKIIEDTEEILYAYKLLWHILSEKQKQHSVILYIGSGNVGISMFNDQKIQFSQKVKIGALRISELFYELQNESKEYYKIVEDYLQSFTRNFDYDVLKHSTDIISLGPEVNIIAKICKATEDGIFSTITKEKFIEVYNVLKVKTVDNLLNEFDVPIEKTQSIIPALCILYSFFNMTNAKSIVVLNMYYFDGIVFENLYPETFKDINKEFQKFSIISAKSFANKYNIAEDNYKYVEEYGLKIFDKMKKIHGLSQKEKLYLQISCILRDIGSFISKTKHYNHSYYMIKFSEIVGLSLKEREIVAMICMYHSSKTPKINDKQITGLNSSERVLVSKLVAILRLADGLGQNINQYFPEIDIKLTDDELIISILTDDNIDLVEWSFKNKSAFFEEVFGIEAVLKKRRSI